MESLWPNRSEIMCPEYAKPENILKAQVQYLKDLDSSIYAVLTKQDGRLILSVGHPKANADIRIFELSQIMDDTPYPVQAKSLYSNTKSFEISTDYQLVGFLRTSFNCPECKRVLSKLLQLSCSVGE